MKRLWLVLNVASGSTSADIVDAFDRACASFEIVGRTNFPADDLPDAATLDRAGCDTLVVFGGDGTINAATARADDWAGGCLVLPGGTMNGLAKALHGDRGWADILRLAPGAPVVHPPVAVAGTHRGLVGVILGPAAAWFHARERVREGAIARLGRALRFAMRKTFARTVRVVGDPGHAGRYRAIIVTPLAHDLEVASIRTSTWLAAARLGFDWLLGNWRGSRDVSVSHAPSVELASSRTVSALFDGEPVKLRSPVTIVHALTRLGFVATRDQPG
ncbi:MAG: diacylglycerol/lipid kinase family protein [Janthinobacterium lividum]